MAEQDSLRDRVRAGERGRKNPHYQGSRVDPPPRQASPAAPRGPGRFARYGGGAAALAMEAPQLVDAARRGQDELLAEAPRSAGRLAGATYGFRAGSHLGKGRGAVLGGLVGGTVGYVGGEKAVDTALSYTVPGGLQKPFAAGAASIRGAVRPGGAVEGAASSAAPGPLSGWLADRRRRNLVADSVRQAVEGGRGAPGAAEGPRAAGRPPAQAQAAPAPAPQEDFVDRLGNEASTAPQGRMPYVAPGSENTFTGRDGVTRRVNAAPERVRATASPSTSGRMPIAAARGAQEITRRAAATRGRAESALLNPMGSQAELVRRLQNTQTSYRNRGSPQARRMAAQPYLEALGMAGAADMEGLRSGNDVIARGVDNEAAAEESFARRSDEAQRANQTADVAREGIEGRAYAEMLRAQGDQAKAADDARVAARGERRDVFNQAVQAFQAEGMDYDTAVAQATQRLDDMNLGGSSLPEGVGARTRESAAMESGVSRRSMGGLGEGVSNFFGLGGLRRDAGDWAAGTSSNAEIGQGVFNPDNYSDAQDPTARQRIASALLPDGGELAWPTVLDRASGRRIRVPPQALGASTEAFNRRRLESAQANY